MTFHIDIFRWIADRWNLIYKGVRSNGIIWRKQVNDIFMSRLQFISYKEPARVRRVVDPRLYCPLPFSWLPSCDGHFHCDIIETELPPNADSSYYVIRSTFSSYFVSSTEQLPTIYLSPMEVKDFVSQLHCALSSNLMFSC